ncbi:MAG TPA: cysteine desulfurase family protein [Desulfomonilaceae bacterium]|nr:cysteine desulfurase family protein [Desulfomonilaceae bacterium]
MEKPIYLDYNGTTPLDPEVVAAMQPFFEEFGNPSSTHWYGIAPKQAVAKAREQVASLLNCGLREIVFTSGGTESNNYAIAGTAFRLQGKGNHIVTCRIEHPAVLEVCRFLETLGFRVTYLPVDESGLLRASDVAEAVTSQTILITIMHANNEVGTVQPIEEISEIARNRGIVFHTDAAQSVGKIPIDVNELAVDLLSVAGHKVYAPKGVGALYIRRQMEPEKFMLGAGQEDGKRAGTENVLGIVGLGKACEIAGRDLKRNMSVLKTTRDNLQKGIQEKLGDLVRFNGHAEKRLPNTLSLSFRGVEADRILEEIGLDVAASAGAACHSGDVSISHVLEAMKVPLEWAKGTLRFTTGKFTTEAEIAKAIDVVSDAVLRLSNTQH